MIKPTARYRKHAMQAVRFIVTGGSALVVDASVLFLLTRFGGLNPFSARAIAIGVAIVYAYFAHRRVTFAVREPASLAQFAKFCSVAVSVAAINFAVYAGVLMFVPGSNISLAFVIATATSVMMSFFGYRFGVFNEPKP